MYARLSITNTGSRDRAEVAQLYLKLINFKMQWPVHDLKAFKKVVLKKGESKVFEFILATEAFLYYSTLAGDWKVSTGDYELQVGSSSRNIKTTGMVRVAQ